MFKTFCEKRCFKLSMLFFYSLPFKLLYNFTRTIKPNNGVFKRKILECLCEKSQRHVVGSMHGNQMRKSQWNSEGPKVSLPSIYTISSFPFSVIPNTPAIQSIWQSTHLQTKEAAIGNQVGWRGFPATLRNQNTPILKPLSSHTVKFTEWTQTADIPKILTYASWYCSGVQSHPYYFCLSWLFLPKHSSGISILCLFISPTFICLSVCKST